MIKVTSFNQTELGIDKMTVKEYVKKVEKIKTVKSFHLQMKQIESLYVLKTNIWKIEDILIIE